MEIGLPAIVGMLLLPAVTFALAYSTIVTHLSRGLISPYTKADVRKRFSAALVDGLVVMTLSLGYWTGDSPLYLAIGAAYLLLRDAIGGRSIGKLLAGLVVINLETGRVSSVAGSAKRNLLLLLPGANVVAIFLEARTIVTDPQGQRLGDRLAQTQVVEGAGAKELVKSLQDWLMSLGSGLGGPVGGRRRVPGRIDRLGRIAVVAWLLCCPATSGAQTVELTPIYGYRFGGEFFEIISGQPVDLDGTTAVGGVVNVKFDNVGMFVEALYTHQEARFTTPGGAFIPSADWRITVDHLMGGGTQEFNLGHRVRPFLTGLLGVTRYAAEGDSEIRFTIGAGGGVKLMPARRIGLRLDGRVFATFADFDSQAFACVTPPGCVVAVDANVVWQAEFSVGLVVAVW